MDLLIRADAGPRTGTGHVMRCLALAQAWRRAGGKTTFATATDLSSLEDRLRSNGSDIVRIEAQAGDADDAVQTADHARHIGAAWVVVDGYQFGSDYHHALKENVPRLMVVDDNAHLGGYIADVVLNQNIYASEDMYAGKAHDVCLLLGARYVLLREEFLRWTDWERRTPPAARKLLVTMGGSDPDNVTLKVVRALKQLKSPGLEARVVVGSANRHLGTLRREVHGHALAGQLLSEVEDMSELMAWADVAISASGSTCWELAFMGLPSLLLVLAENQVRTAVGLDQAGVAWNLGCASQVSESEVADRLVQLAHNADRRRNTRKRGRRLVDGLGVERVVRTLATAFGNKPVELVNKVVRGKESREASV